MGQKVILESLLSHFGADPRTHFFSHFWVTFIIFGLRAFQEGINFTILESQQLTYGVVSEGVFAESLRKFCGKFTETTFYCARKGCGNSAEISRKFAENFLQWPLPERPHKWTVENLLSEKFPGSGEGCLLPTDTQRLFPATRPYWESGYSVLDPVLLFLGLFENTKGNLKNTKDFSHLANPWKPWKISRKHPERPRNFAASKNTKETKTPRKRRTGEALHITRR